MKRILLKSKIVRGIISLFDKKKDEREHKKFLRNKKKAPSKFYYKFLPIQTNKIVFDNFTGHNFSGRPRIIAEELLKANRNLDLVWVSFEKPKDLPNEIRWVKYGTQEAGKEWATAKVWVDNVRHTLRPPKRKCQFYIQTWHGDIGIKAVERDAEEVLPKYYIDVVKKDAVATDVFTSTCKWCTNLIKKSFWYDGEIMPVMFEKIQNKSEIEIIKKKVKDYFGISKTKKIILYAPTFRNNDSISAYGLDYENLINVANQKYNSDFCVLVRLHPNALSYSNNIAYSDNVINASAYTSVKDLILASTFVISDYSSVVFEAMRYKIYSLIFATDYERYFATERKNYFDIKKLPAPFASSNEELTKNILTFDEKDYLVKVKAFNDVAGYYDDEKSLSSLCGKIVKFCLED